MATASNKKAQTGDLIPPLLKSAITRVQISQFAAATNDFNPMHVDEALARTKGYSGICAHPQLALSYIEEMLWQYAETLQVSSLNVTFQKLIWPGDLLTSKGLISKRYEEDGMQKIDIDIWTENQNQDVVLKGKAICSF
jgi:acyl dehydratase